MTDMLAEEQCVSLHWLTISKCAEDWLAQGRLHANTLTKLRSADLLFLSSSSLFCRFFAFSCTTFIQV